MVRGLLATALVLLAAPGAAATIVPQKGMAGVELGMTRAEVRAVLGEPLRVIRGTNEFGEYTEFPYPFRVRIVFQFDTSVTAVETTGRRERTSRGVGVGSTEAEVKANVPRVRCETFFGFRSCYLGTLAEGTKVTEFHIRDGRVWRVTVGIVID